MRRALAAACAAALLLAGCGGTEPEPAPGSTAASPSGSPAAAPDRSVLAVSVDGLDPDAMTGPAFDRLLEEGLGTRNARTAVELTVTLPNHTGMLTGRRVDAEEGGHGVTWNVERPGATVPGPDGTGVASVFDVVHAAGGTTALFAGKDKFALFEQSWPDAIDEFAVDEDPEALVADAVEDLTQEERRFTFLHLALPDEAGHAHGWLSPEYDAAVAETDRLLGEVLAAVDATPRLREGLVVVLTADHGGLPGERSHSDPTDPDDYRVPFVVWGAGTAPGDLYERNPDRADPGGRRPAYDAPRPPVRNGDLANVALTVLGLGPVPGSELDADQRLDVD